MLASHIMLLINIVVSAVEVMIAPESQTVTEGESAIFNCTITGASDIPGWIINGSFYSADDLPR